MNDQVTKTDVLGEAQSAGEAATTTAYLNDLVTAVCAPAMSLSCRDGQVRPLGVEGLYVQDLRALSQCVLTVDGSQPVPLGCELVGGPANEFHGAVAGAGNPGPDLSVFVSRRRALNPAGMEETFKVSSRARSPVSCRVEVRFGCDLASMAALRSGRRPGTAYVAVATDDGLEWDVPGRASVRLSCSPRPTAIDAASGSVRWEVVVEPGRAVTCSASVELVDQGAPAVFVAALAAQQEAAQPEAARADAAQPDAAQPEAARADAAQPDAALPEAAQGGAPVLEVDAVDPRLKRFVDLSLGDLEGLRMAAPADPADAFLAAGAPWYLTLFGRDSIWAARLLLPLGTELARGTLRTLATRQGQVFNKETSEEPGKILHEVRRPDMSAHLKVDDGHGERAVSLPPVYYGTVDATPLWVCLLHDAWRWGMPAADVEPLLDPMQRCLDWLAEFGCHADGFVSYVDESGRGLANQGWKDSWDAVQFRDGRIARAPLALCEVQGYAYESAMAGAELLEAFGRDGADRWCGFAVALAERFRARFWVEDEIGPYPAMALEADGTPVDSLASNIGHLLGTGILNGPECEVVAERLLDRDLNSGFGLRTLAASSRGFNPLSYHCGSVWAHDTAIAIAGLARTPGATARKAALALIDGLLSAAEGFGYRLPELYGGHSRRSQPAPLPYPASCHPQAWAAASSVAITAALTGLRPDVPGGAVTLEPMVDGPDPRSAGRPGSGLGSFGLRSVGGVRVGDATVTVNVGGVGGAFLAGCPPELRWVPGTKQG
ncbi:MAG TPA: glycogen debranching N-terminal domain-containing protein [Acidimicrobiales bacterium]|nr:glycogen debranching N-terminal domain-containing protein [Acidimicrobiales bacterium]